ncbi:hypothetical protein [Phenylobacterium montanum]|uniref:Porin n=1 Tax=Phenylobacterium montanum TaxID=2823693 RepID=A0A975G0I8_9CAUL|nr:hypothetical protein [Caulobacter sp. S6]QUD88359.1 hypothetical protein KCG34_00235 [Caulobacter sp. S6]
MRDRFSLLGGAALGVLAALSFAAAAEAKPHHKRHPAAPPAATAEQVKALADEIESLKARLDQEQIAREQTEAKAQAAQAEASAAKADAASAKAQLAAQIQTLPGEVKQAVVANTPKPGWWGDTKVGGLVFADVSNIDQKSNGVRTNTQNGFPSSNGYGFDIKRAYLTFDHKFNDIYSANITTDFTYDATTKSTQLFIKKAYLQAKYSDALVIRAGDVDLPWVPFVENLAGYRFVENMLIDRIKYGTTTDTSLNVNGTFPVAPVTLGYSVSLLDGSGFKAPGDGNFNRSKQMDVEGRINATVDNFTVAVGGYSGDLGKNVNGSAFYHSANRLDALVAYVNPRFRVGGEYVYVRNFTDGTQAAKPVKATGEGYSVFGSFSVTPKVSVFGRYDWVNPEQDVLASTAKANSATRDEYFNLGLDYSPVQSVDLALVYKRDSVSNGLLTTTNGAAAPGSAAPQGSGLIGGIPAGGLLNSGTYDEFGIFTQYRF